MACINVKDENKHKQNKHKQVDTFRNVKDESRQQVNRGSDVPSALEVMLADDVSPLAKVVSHAMRQLQSE